MIEITSFDLGIPHGIVPVGDLPGVDHSGDVAGPATSNLFSAEAPTSALKIHVSNPNDPYDGTVFDKDLWLNAPHPDDGDKVCEWAKDMAAAQPKATCDQWSSDDWDAWADEYGKNDCDIPRCGESFNPQLEPMYQQHTGDSYLNTLQHHTQSQLAVIPEGIERVQNTKLNLDSSKPAFLPSLSCDSEAQSTRGSESPRPRAAILNLDKDASVPAPLPGMGEEDEEDTSPNMTERTWDVITKTRASPGHLVLSCHAMTLAAVETSIKGGNRATFKEDALANAGAITPVGKALLEKHVFAEKRNFPEAGCEYSFDVFYDTPVEGEIYAF